MSRFALTLVLAVGGFLAADRGLSADDTKLPTGGATAKAQTVTLGGRGTAASAAAADTEQTWYHGYYRGYRNGFYAGYYGGFAPYYAGYYPYSFGYPYVPTYYYPPVVGVGYYGRFGGVSVGLYGINGTRADAAAPAVSLNLGGTSGPSSLGGRKPASTPAGPYPYDGGPANSAPLPSTDSVQPSAPATGLPVSLPKNPQPTKPYTYKAYGEK